MKHFSSKYFFFALVLLLVPFVALVAGMERTLLYSHKDLNADATTNIFIEGEAAHTAKLKQWLDEIVEIEHGRQTLDAIINSGHNLVISHSYTARISAGRTLADMSSNLTNGKGMPVTILFDATIDDQGSHIVFNGKREPVEYTAVENLYHELAHAKHKMNGTWRYFDSEGQAIEEENIFRRDLAIKRGTPITERLFKTGMLIDALTAKSGENRAGN